MALLVEVSVLYAALARVETEKKLSLIRAWEESEKAKANTISRSFDVALPASENFVNVLLSVSPSAYQENLEKKKTEYAEKMKNKMALVHKAAEEKRAAVEAKKGEELLKAEEMAAKYHATGQVPKKSVGCF
ncbi:hypothetical protein MLD38_025671 [Melastoma candidum]|uniref:Uncharacterized protein n=1 Tax=Melastoma candidum TaxID=119954 RepID=A0ACB9NX17_9MYRT|nr:hypothetical protein MLD38_025671 [Melastoma candidum]